MINSQPIISVRNLVKKYDDLIAVNDVSFDVHVGEIFGLLGPNGAGKTTTLEIMETLRDPDSGDVIIDGHSIKNNKNSIKQIIGVQLQQSGFYPNLSLMNLVHLFAGLYNMKVNVKEILNSVGLGDKIHAKFNKLSGGQKQRFAVATTLINKPKIIFLDEPTTGLDPHARRNLWEMIFDMKKNGTTVMLTTHYLDEAEQLCDRVGIIDLGKVIALDTPSVLIDNLIRSGFKRSEQVKDATLEDVFLNLTGKELRDE